jgi:hypothetical protein
MYKYGEPSNVNNGTTNSIIPRNLTYKYNNNSVIKTVSAGSTSSGSNFTSANVTDLTVNTLYVTPNTPIQNIVVGSAIAFSELKIDYIANNFKLYPVFFSQDVLIKNKNLYLQSENVKIKDNIIMINSDLLNVSIVNNETDNVLSGFIFPISDKNIDTGYYAGLIYFPNNKIEKISPNSTVYKWLANNYNYFSNINKGYFKLKYISQNVSFSQYQNNLDSNYEDLVNNNKNLTNLLVGSIGIGDGEISSINGTSLSLVISDGNTIFSTLNINKSTIHINNNLSFTFSDNLIIGNNYEYINFGNNFVSFLQNTLYNTDDYYINFNKVLNYFGNSNNKLMFTVNSVTDKIQMISPLSVNTIVVLESFQLNNIPIIFNNTLEIVGNTLSFIFFDALKNSISLNQDTYITNLIINNSLNVKNNPIIFQNKFIIQDDNNISYINFDASGSIINLLSNTYSSNFYIRESFNLVNDIPILIKNNFIVGNSIKQYINFSQTQSTMYNNIFLDNSTPQINFAYGKTLSLVDNNSITSINIDSGINIVGPFDGYNDISNTCVNSSLSLTNTIIKDYNFTYIPLDKTFILAGITQSNRGLLKLVCNNVCFQTLMSGTIIGTTRSIESNNICMYNINIWTYIDNNDNLQIANTSLLPINTVLRGDWVISDLVADQPNSDNKYNLYINCIGSLTEKVIWSFKVCALSV